ncbi:MAG: DsbC family protein [Geobacteraceae bacterium]|nr:DsbC family protein [Geobacteraceae bacterium]
MKWLFILLAALLASEAYGFGTGAEGCSGDCTACHTVKKEEAAAVVKGLDPDTVVEAVGPSPVRGLYQVTVKKGDASGIVYMDFSKRFIIAGRIIDAGEKRDVTQEKMEELRRIDPARIPLDNALRLGGSEGRKKLFVFTDPECPYCAKLHEELVALVKEDPGLQVAIILTPLEIHPDATRKTDAIVCASRKNMADGMRLLEQSLAGKAVSESGCGGRFGEAGKKLGRELGIGMTPTMVFANGKVVSGARKREEIRKLIEEAEKDRDRK